MNLKQEAEAVRILKHAKALIEDENYWIKRSFAKNELFQTVNPYSPDACFFCASGANRHAGGMGRSEESRDYLAMATYLMTKGEYSYIARFNDRATHEEVMELFDVAIEWAIGADSVGMEL